MSGEIRVNNEVMRVLAADNADRSGFWSAFTRILKRRHSRRFSVEDGIYLDDIDYESMDPEELSKFFPHK